MTKNNEVGIVTIVMVSIVLSLISIAITKESRNDINSINTITYNMSWSISKIKDEIDNVWLDTNQIERTIESIRDSVKTNDKTASRVYDIEITMCLSNTETDTIEKKFIRMNNIIAVNPNINWSALYVNTWLSYWDQVLIPWWFENDDGWYSCNIKIISIR